MSAPDLIKKATKEFNDLRYPECWAIIKEIGKDYLIVEFLGTKINFACCFDENFYDYQYYLKDFANWESLIKEIKKESNKFIVKYQLIKKEVNMTNSEKKGIPLLGENFPEMEVLTTHGLISLPHAYKGKWFVLFSHPADFTPVCTTEFYAFQKRYPEFRKLNCELIGLSVDQVFSHIKWIEWIKEKLNMEIEFPIIADTGKVAEALGLIHPKKGTNTVRAVFVVDPEGKIRIILYYPQELGRNIDEILRAVEGIQIADKYGVAMPANWPNNEIIKDRVIIPPAGTIKIAQERLAKAKAGEFECFDWWFCHKKIR
jgi:peroxiredoxin (alkyl hydroperoxide reductase subunit C)